MSIDDWFQIVPLLLVTVFVMWVVVYASLGYSAHLAHPKGRGMPVWVGVMFFMTVGVGTVMLLALGCAHLIEYLTG